MRTHKMVTQFVDVIGLFNIYLAYFGMIEVTVDMLVFASSIPGVSCFLDHPTKGLGISLFLFTCFPVPLPVSIIHV